MGKPAARVTDMHTCPMVTGLVPHVGGPILPPCAPTVLTGNLPQARVTDMLVCVGPPDMIAVGSATVLVQNMPAARLGDQTVHGGVIVVGLPTVLIGDAGGGGGGAGGGAAGAPSSMPAPLPAATIAKFKDQLAKLIDRIMGRSVTPTVQTGLGYRVDQLASRSPTLVANLKDLDGKCDIAFGEEGKGTYYDPNALPRPKIIVDPADADNPEAVVQSLAHESGHALYTIDPYVPPDGLSRQDYVDRNVQRDLKNEGEATLTNAQVRKEILDDGGPDIGIAGAQSQKYAEIAEKYPDPKDRDQARTEIGQIFADGEQPSGDENAGKTYRQYYAKSYEDFYDANPPAGGSP